MPLVMDFSHRSPSTELMDTEAVTYEDFRACLADLAKVNRITLAARPTLAFIKRAARGRTHLHIADIGCGNGDMLRKIARWAQRRQLAVTLTGIDLNPYSARAAAEATGEFTIDFVTEDAFAWQPAQPVDVIISSLFTHHLPDAAIVRFLQWMETSAGRGWFVNDLYRSPVAYHGFTLLARLAGWHRFVRHDGPVSIARSFQRDDWRQRLAEAGIAQVKIVGWFPFRLCVSRLK